MYLQKCDIYIYCRGEIIDLNDNNKLYKSIVCFMISALKESVPHLIESSPVTCINNECFK